MASGACLLIELSKTVHSRVDSAGQWRFDLENVCSWSGVSLLQLSHSTCQLRVVPADQAAPVVPVVFEASFVSEASVWDGRYCRFLGVSTLEENPSVPVCGRPFLERFHLTCRPLFSDDASKLNSHLFNKLALLITFS